MNDLVLSENGTQELENNLLLLGLSRALGEGEEIATETKWLQFD